MPLFCLVFLVLGFIWLTPTTVLHFQARKLKFSLIRPQNIPTKNVMFCQMASSKFQAWLHVGSSQNHFPLAGLPLDVKCSNACWSLDVFPPFQPNCSGMSCSIWHLVHFPYKCAFCFVRFADLRSVWVVPRSLHFALMDVEG